MGAPTLNDARARPEEVGHIVYGRNFGRTVVVNNVSCVIHQLNLSGDLSLPCRVFGITTIQVVVYYSRFRRDTMLNRIVVSLLARSVVFDCYSFELP